MDGSKLLALLEEKADVLRQLMAFVELQQELITDDRMTALLELLAEKQKVLARFGELQSSLAPFLTQDPALRKWPDKETHQAAREQHAVCEQLLRDLLSAEATSENALQASRTRVLQQLEDVDRSAAAANAYDADPLPPSQFDFGLS